MAKQRQEKKRAKQEPKAPPKLSRQEVDDLIATLKDLGPEDRAEYLEAFSDSMTPEVMARVEQALVPCVALVPIGCRAATLYTRYQERHRLGRVRGLFNKAQLFHLTGLVDLAIRLLAFNPLQIVVFLSEWVKDHAITPTRPTIWMRDGRKRKLTPRRIREFGRELLWLTGIAGALPKKQTPTVVKSEPVEEPEFVPPCTALVPRQCTALVRYTWPQDQGRREQAQELFTRVGVGYEQISAAYHRAKELLSNDPLRVEVLYLQWLARRNPQKPAIPTGPAEYEIKAARESLRECLFDKIIRGKLEALAAASLAADPCKVLRDHIANGNLDDSDSDILELIAEGPQMLLKKEGGKSEIVVIRTDKQQEIKAYGLELMRQEGELKGLLQADDPRAAFLERIGKGDLFLSVNEMQRVLADMVERTIQHLISLTLCEEDEFDPLDILAGLGVEESATSLPLFQWPTSGASTSADFDLDEVDLLSLLEGSEFPAGTQTLEQFKKETNESRIATRRQERQRMRRRVIAAIRGEKGQGSTTFHAAGIVALNQERRELLADLLREDPREIKRMGLPPDVLAALNHVYREREFARLSCPVREEMISLWSELQGRRLIALEDQTVDKIEWIVWLYSQLVQIQSYVNGRTFFSNQAEEGEQTQGLNRREAEKLAREQEDFRGWQEENPEAGEPLWYPAVSKEAPVRPTRRRRPKKVAAI